MASGPAAPLTKRWHERKPISPKAIGWVVDIDLEKFFDRVNHDRLMARVAERVGDQRLLRLIRGFLTRGRAGRTGCSRPDGEGTPQGGPLSPLLSNLVLDELDQELERRGHRFVRYADDCNIYVRSERAGQRVMASLTRFIERAAQASGQHAEECGGPAVAPVVPRLQLHGRAGAPKRCIADQAMARFKTRVRELTRRHGASAWNG